MGCAMFSIRSIANGRVPPQGGDGSASPLLDVEDLRVRFHSKGEADVDVVRGVSFQMGPEKLGIVGESGSGKSITARSILRVLPHGSSVTARRIAYRGRDLLDLPESAMRQVRGRNISMIMQDPRYSLNPTIRVGRQIAEMVRIHFGTGSAEAMRRAEAALESVRMKDPKRVMHAYPHEISGGMGQRVMIAMMLVAEPSLLIADEPTSALDVSIQIQILSLLDDLVASRNMGLILISHDMQLVSSFCDRVLVMYRGEIVERCEATELHNARHPYTRQLLAATPQLQPAASPLQ
jgi:peptide/nickel transport system ATP-binding protein